MKRIAYFFNLLIFIGIVASCNAPAAHAPIEVNIIPIPASVQTSEGTFLLSPKSVIIAEDQDQQEAASSLNALLNEVIGVELQTSEAIQENAITFVKDESLSREAYQLIVEKQGIKIIASSFAGYFYGIQSLSQLIPSKSERGDLISDYFQIPALEIKDQPRFQWRGMMLDVSRHFFSKEYVLKTIDRLAMHKMNVLHFHLVDDQGWRIEIKKYPELTSLGAWRVDEEDKHWNARPRAPRDQKGTYGGFYTQDDLKEIVAYAAKKNVEVIPEIEMPAHVSPALAAYPYLGCFDQPDSISVPSGGVWPITDIYCAGKETTFEFLENVLAEVFPIFPSTYVHIGGDEATKTKWLTCPHCQKRMKEEGLESVEELQSYFIKRMEKFVMANNKKLIGWDEILEGGLAPDAAVMSWRGVEGGLKASEEGHPVVMTPTSHCYIDYYQGPQDSEPLAIGGYLPVSKVYSFDPVVEGMSEAQASLVLGGQVNLWTEYVPTESHADYMIFPRLTAMAEVLWSPKESKNWEDFSRRLEHLFIRYADEKINYSNSIYSLMSEESIDSISGAITIALSSEFPTATVKYTVNDGDTLEYSQPFQLNSTSDVKAWTSSNGKLLSKIFQRHYEFHKAAGKEVSFLSEPNARYIRNNKKQLTDVIRGSKNIRDGNWMAWLGNDMEVVIDLEEETSIHSVGIGTIEHHGSWVYFPTSIKVEVSTDGIHYLEVAQQKITEEAEPNGKLAVLEVMFEKTNAKYVKITASSRKSHPQREGALWLFVDEIFVN